MAVWTRVFSEGGNRRQRTLKRIGVSAYAAHRMSDFGTLLWLHFWTPSERRRMVTHGEVALLKL
jgi:hypothetical protein